MLTHGSYGMPVSIPRTATGLLPAGAGAAR